MNQPEDNQLLHFDEDGFLLETGYWNHAVARYIAKRDGITEIIPEQWVIIDSLRDHYFRLGAPPVMRHICNVNHMDHNCVNALFGQSSLEAWRIAGLPNPGEEAKAYLQ